MAGVDRNEVVVGFRIVMSFKLWFYECVLGSGDFRYELHSSGRPGNFIIRAFTGSMLPGTRKVFQKKCRHKTNKYEGKPVCTTLALLNLIK